MNFFKDDRIWANAGEDAMIREIFQRQAVRGGHAGNERG